MLRRPLLLGSCLAAATIVITLALGLLSAAPDILEIKIRRGDSVSYLCFKHLGAYNKDIAAEIKRLNPKIKDINLIYVGQKLQFRKPITDTTKTTEVDKEVDPVFYKKVDATQGVVTFVEGSAKITKKGKSTPEKLSPNVVVYPGDIIKTGDDGRVELIINRESVVRLKENTESTIETFRDLKKKEGKTALNFSVGSIWSKSLAIGQPPKAISESVRKSVPS